jgi:hypothetical protein
MEKLDLHFPKTDKALLPELKKVRIALQHEGKGRRPKKVAGPAKDLAPK